MRKPAFRIQSIAIHTRGPLLFALLFALLLGAAVNVGASTVTAASCSASAVAAALNQASAGDTVFIPAGTCSWTTGVSWTAPANVTLMGAGTSATGGGDQTVIIDNIGTNTPVMAIQVSSTGIFRMTGITVQSGTGATKDAGTIALYGPGTVRLDHLHLKAISTANYRILDIGGGVFGVIHHSILDLSGTNAIYVHNSRGGDGMGNYEWTLLTAFGGSDYFFIEDNIINGTNDSYPATRIYDCYTAGRVVARFNSLTASTIGEDHATGHSADDRGCRSHELYGNSLTASAGQVAPNFCMTDIGSGTALIWGNTAGANSIKNVMHFNVTRKNNATYSQSTSGWGYCGTQFNGTGSVWDQNSDTTTGYACIDQPGRGPGDLITGYFPNKLNNRTGTRIWPQQPLEPMYLWKNTGSAAAGWGGTYWANDTGDRVVANRDYYAEVGGVQTSPTSPFNGTTGMGWGTLANRPTTCTTGVGYFATDQGSWNTSTSNPYGVQQNGADGVLYKCTATNTWTLYYTPYTYPHPLTQTGTSPRAPLGLRIN